MDDTDKIIDKVLRDSEKIIISNVIYQTQKDMLDKCCLKIIKLINDFEDDDVHLNISLKLAIVCDELQKEFDEKWKELENTNKIKEN